MNTEVNSQISDTHSEALSLSDTVGFNESNTYKQYGLFNKKLYGEETGPGIVKEVDKETGQWISAFPHLRIVGKNIFPVRNGSDVYDGEYVDEIIAEHHDTDFCHAQSLSDDIDIMNDDTDLKSSSIWGSKTVILDGHPDDKSVSDEFYDFDKDLDKLYSYSALSHQESQIQQNHKKEYRKNNKLPQNKSDVKLNTPSEMSKNFLSEKSTTFIKLTSSFKHDKIKSKSHDMNEREKLAVIKKIPLSPLEKKVNKFPYRRVPSRVSSKFSNSEKSVKVQTGTGILVQTVTSKTSFKPNLSGMDHLTRIYKGSTTLNHYNKIPPIQGSKK